MFATAFPHAIIRRLEGRDHQLNDDLSELGHDIRLLELESPTTRVSDRSGVPPSASASLSTGSDVAR
jgi:hypothetical protein